MQSPLVLALLSCCLTLTLAQNKANDNVLDPKCGVVQYGPPIEEGREFTVAYVEVPDDKSGQRRQLLIKVTTDRDKKLGIVARVPRRSNEIANFTTVSKGQVAQMDLSGSEFLSTRGSSVFTSSTVQVVANGDFKVFVSSQQGQRQFGYWAIPNIALGREYMVLTYAPLNALTNDRAECGIIAVKQGDTRIIVRLPARRTGRSNLIVTFQGRQYNNGDQIVRVISQYDFMQLQATADDLTGARITGSKDIGVICGNTLSSMASQIGLIGDRGSADTMIEQFPPIESWGKEFVSFLPSQALSFAMQYRIKIVAAYHNTKFTINGAAKKLAAGESYEIILEQRLSTNVPVVIKSNKPIMPVQYVQSAPSSQKSANGRSKRWSAPNAFPSMILMPATEQFARRFTFDAAKYDYRSDWTYSHFLIVAVETTWKNCTLSVHPRPNQLRLNGRTLDMTWIEADDNKYQVGYLEVPWGQHTLDSSDQRAVFGAWLYGAQRNARGSFGYSLGLNLRKSTCETCPIIGCELRDNDCDMEIDEEIEDGKDNDGDGKIDEDVCGYWDIQGMSQNTLWTIIGAGGGAALILGILAIVFATQT